MIDSFKIVTTRNSTKLELPPNSKGYLKETSPPIEDKIVTKNEWKNAKEEEVEAYCLSLNKKNLTGVDTSLFVLLDS